ncbi:hypothetical protein RBB78_14365 [Tunturiibacter empetritectus]|uniref:hypothetical protein n=1 Tax=Tunturiibacter empetritectus TaxID=3069691 RepID=UPI003D9AFE4D
MTKGRLKTVLWAVLPLAAGLALRLWYVLHAGRIEGDALIYGGIAKNWLRYGIYGFTLGTDLPKPTLIRLPGYPSFSPSAFASSASTATSPSCTSSARSTSAPVS